MEDDHVLDAVPVEHIKAAPSKCTENDVILGRGRAINNWPGNVHFRQLALKYREAYSQANRYQKVEIARLVMAEITARDGRFVQLVDHPKSSSSSSLKASGRKDCDFVVVSQVNEARAIEKTCQALRDRCFYDKQVVHDHNERPVGTNVNAAIPAHLNDDDYDDVDATEAAGIPGNDDDHHHVQESTLTSGIDVLPTNTDTNPDQRKPTRRRRDRPLLVSFSTLDMLQRLRHFQSTFSHARVPPNYQDDVVLADWCTVQRQLYRQYQTGYYNVLLPQQQSPPPAAAPLPPLDQPQMDLFHTLNSMNFCWDYDEWHWHYWLDQAMATGNDPLDKSVRVWLHQQRRQHRDGTLSRLRSEKMQQAGFLPASGTKMNLQTGT
jgi:Helicase associated domain